MSPVLFLYVLLYALHLYPCLDYSNLLKSLRILKIKNSFLFFLYNFICGDAQYNKESACRWATTDIKKHAKKQTKADTDRCEPGLKVLINTMNAELMYLVFPMLAESGILACS